jgi:hypothetical protein
MRQSILVSFLAVMCFAIAPSGVNAVTATFPTLARQINSPDGTSDFGFAFNSFDSNLLVGAIGGPNSAAYLINLNTGAQILKVNSPDAGNGEISFGDAVFQVGQNFAVADHEYDVSSSLRRVGSVYVFNGTTGQLVRTIRDPNPATFNGFGATLQTVAGNLWINSQSISSNSSGKVYVFNPTSGQLLNTISNPEPGSGNWGFGFQMLERQGGVYISAIGNPVSGANPGAVYRYDSTTLTQTLKISAPNPQTDSDFGISIAQNDTQLLIGSPNNETNSTGKAYLFDPNTGALLRTFSDPEPKQFDEFGKSVALYQGYAFIGDPDADINPGGTGPQNVGAFYVFDVNSGNYLGRVVNPAGGQNNIFTYGEGANGGLDIIGNSLVAAKYLGGTGSVYVYGVPEPSTITLLTLGAIGLLFARRRLAG